MHPPCGLEVIFIAAVVGFLRRKFCPCEETEDCPCEETEDGV